MAQDHRLTWGGITLSEPNEVPDSEAGWVIAALSDTSFGNPGGLSDIADSLFAGGLLAVAQGRDFREVSIRLCLSAPEETAGPALAAAEAALMEQVLADQPPPLVWTPPATDAEPTVFDVIGDEDYRPQLDWDTSDGWDFSESDREERYFLLTLTCLPFARALDAVTVPALAPNPPTPTTSLVDDGTSTANWSATAAGFGTVLRRNLIRNPSFETGVSYWSKSGSLADFWRQQAGPQAGAWRAVMERLNEGSATCQIASSQMPVTAGLAYTASGSARYKGGYPFDTEVGIRWRNSSGGTISTTFDAGVNPGTSWQRGARINAVAPTGATTAQTLIRFTTPGGFGEYLVYVDAVMFEQSATLGTYLDGSTPDGATVFVWEGTAHASPSAEVDTTVTPEIVVGTNAAVRVFGDATPWDGLRSLTLTRSAAVDMTGLPYLRVSLASGLAGSVSYSRTFRADGSPVTPVAQLPSDIAGYTDYYLEVDDFTDLDITLAETSGEATDGLIGVAHIEATDTIAYPATRQKSRTATVTGAAPTQASLDLADTTGPLGKECLIYTSRSEFFPALRADWLADANVAASADPDAVSGAYNDITSGYVTYRIPVSELTPGNYALMVRLYTLFVSQPFSWEVKLTDAAGNDVLGSDVTYSGDATTPDVADEYVIMTLDTVPLPPVMAEGDQYVQITLSAGADDIFIDEVWPFNLDTGALTWVVDPSETLQWLEIRSPELDALRPAVYGSTSGDGAGAVDVSHLCKSFGTHEFEVGSMQVVTVTTASEASESNIRFYRRFHSHVYTEAA